jgi:hypothetical protein
MAGVTGKDHDLVRCLEPVGIRFVFAVGRGPVAVSVGIEGGVVSGVINLESPGVRAPSRRPRHENRYYDA